MTDGHTDIKHDKDETLCSKSLLKIELRSFNFKLKIEQIEHRSFPSSIFAREEAFQLLHITQTYKIKTGVTQNCLYKTFWIKTNWKAEKWEDRRSNRTICLFVEGPTPPQGFHKFKCYKVAWKYFTFNYMYTQINQNTFIQT